MTTNQAIAKLSPDLPLTSEQVALVNQITKFTIDHLRGTTPAVFTIVGDAGTGKSVVLTHLFTRLQQLARHDQKSPLFKTRNYFTVNHPEILKVYRELAGQQDVLIKTSL